jgi:hypothetical protein
MILVNFLIAHIIKKDSFFENTLYININIISKNGGRIMDIDLIAIINNIIISFNSFNKKIKLDIKEIIINLNNILN